MLHTPPQPCPRCPGQLQIDPRYNPVLAICPRCGWFIRVPGAYTPDATHTARLIHHDS